ncbi:MAG TPA: ABC transporter ATP-binding protein [Saprospiraceae bacterium]|nr:ABC transporter ATP-binding protein [Saprospiraceae bacterium]
MDKLLEINNLVIDFHSEQGMTRAVDGISFFLNKGETLGIVGESGSGKSVSSLSIMRLLPATARCKADSAVYWKNEETNLLTIPDDQMQQIRGAQIAMIFQEPMTSLNPVFRCGEQVTEAIQIHQKVNFETAKKQALTWFEKVKLPDPERIFNAYPHQISGGQKQRVMIAMAMSCNPDLLIADEPTTALDVTVQKAILELMRELRTETGLSMLFISHDLGVISEICDRVIVMHQGKVVEEGTVEQVLKNPSHPYTRGLVACRPSLRQKLWRMPTVPDFLEHGQFDARVITQEEDQSRRTQLQAQPPILEVSHLQVRYPAQKSWWGKVTAWTNAVQDISFQVYPGETFGLAGESGCGKTTLGRTIARLTDAHAGSIRYKGQDLLAMSETEFRPIRKEIQVVFQDPYASLNPKMTIGEAIVEPMKVHRLYENDAARKAKTIELLEIVGLKPDHFQRYPHQFSGGQRQRICVARALALEPKFLVCDEMVSALDVSVQATVLNLLMELRETFGLTYLFISHDLSVIKQMCDRLLIMNQGQMEALGYPEDIYARPERPYVQKLIEAIPGR